MLQAAREWHVAPWEIEEEGSLYWWERWQTLREMEAEAREQKRKEKAGQG